MKTYFAYIRVSTVRQGQHGSSLQEQRDAIEMFAKRQGLPISEWFEERETAATKGRTQFLRMMACLEKKKAAGVLLHKIDRGARNLWDWARIQGLLDAGIEVHFVHDNLDMTSRGGRLAADIQAVVAADYVRNLRDEVRKGLRGRLKQGVYPFKAPLGYLDRGGGKPKTIDPIKGPLVRMAFELYATRRHSFRTLCLELHRRGLVRKSGGPLHLNTLADILHNPFYAGVILIHRTGETFVGIHEPLVSAGLFQRVQDVLSGKSTAKIQSHQALYCRLIRCTHCGKTLIGERQKGRIYYRCHTSGCVTKGIREDVVTTQLLGLIEHLRFSDDEVEDMRPYIEEESGGWTKSLSSRLKAAQLRVAALKERERRLTDAYVDRLLERDAFESRKAVLSLELIEADELRRQAEIEQTDFTLIVGRFFDFIKSLSHDHALRDPVGFREALKLATSNWVVTGKNLYVTMQSPFRELVSDLGVYCGGAYRDTPRTLETTRSASRSRQIVRILRKRLKHWDPPAFTLAANDNDPSPQWKKNLLHQSDRDAA